MPFIFHLLLTRHQINSIIITQDHSQKPTTLTVLPFSKGQRDPKGKDPLPNIFNIYLEPVCPLFWGLNPPKEGRQSKQGAHLGSRYLYLFSKGGSFVVNFFWGGGQTSSFFSQNLRRPRNPKAVHSHPRS